MFEIQDVQTLSLYTFSALIQADAAIFGLFIIFLVYRLQLMEGIKKGAWDTLNLDDKMRKILSRISTSKNIAELFSMLFGMRGDRYRPLLSVLIFTDSWKRKMSKNAMILIIVNLIHIVISCSFLYHSHNNSSFMCFSPMQRIIFGLFSFIISVFIISVVGWIMLFKQNLYSKELPPPLIDPLLNAEQKFIQDYLTSISTFGYFFCVGKPEMNIFVQLQRGANQLVTISLWIKKTETEYDLITRMVDGVKTTMVISPPKDAYDDLKSLVKDSDQYFKDDAK